MNCETGYPKNDSLRKEIPEVFNSLRNEIDNIYEMLGSFCALAEMIRHSSDEVSKNTLEIRRACENSISDMEENINDVERHAKKIESLVGHLGILRSKSEKKKFIR